MLTSMAVFFVSALTEWLIYVLEQAVAEEKFKHCSAAYQSLCDKLAVD